MISARTQSIGEVPACACAWSLAGLLLVFVAGSTTAQVTGFSIPHEEKTLSDGTRVVVNTVSISFDGQYTGSQLLVELDSGSIYNTPAAMGGSDTPPSPMLLGFFPDLSADTFLAQGGDTSLKTLGTFGLGGGAVDLDLAERLPVFNDTTKISQAWNPAGATPVFDQTDMLTVHLALSPDANGNFSYLASAQGEIFKTGPWGITNGAIFVPEPALLGVALPGVLLMRCRRDVG